MFWNSETQDTFPWDKTQRLMEVLGEDLSPSLFPACRGCPHSFVHGPTPTSASIITSAVSVSLRLSLSDLPHEDFGNDIGLTQMIRENVPIARPLTAPVKALLLYRVMYSISRDLDMMSLGVGWGA